MRKKPLIDQLHHEDSWRLFRILAEFVEGFETLAEIDVPLVSVFGSARFGEGHPAYALGYRLGKALAEAGFGVVTGGGPGVMEAVNRGVYEAGGVSVDRPPGPGPPHPPGYPGGGGGGPEGGILKGMRVILATSNPGKVRELKAGLEPLGWTLLSLADFPLRMPKEEGSTFLENALLKAAYVAKATGLPALADDSGLVVPALGGEPGVYSARYGGKETDRERNVYLLERMRHLKGEERKARFVAVLVLAYPDGHAEAYEGSVEGGDPRGPPRGRGLRLRPPLLRPRGGEDLRRDDARGEGPPLPPGKGPGGPPQGLRKGPPAPGGLQAGMNLPSPQALRGPPP
jgi:XTP/dITP diphosphohydrolase